MALQNEDYELHASLTTMMAARTVLNAQRRSVRHLQHEGVLERAEADRLSGRIDRSMERLMRHPPLVRLPDSAALLKAVPWLESASDAQIRALLNAAEVLTFEAEQSVIAQGGGTDGEGVYVLKRGTLLVVQVCH